MEIFTMTMTAPDCLKNCYKIYIDDLHLNIFIGVYEQEKTRKQDINVRIILDVIGNPQTMDDSYDNVVCYDQLVTRIKQLEDHPHCNLLETLAGNILDIALADPSVMKAVVRLNKPEALGDTANISIELAGFQTA